MTSPPVTRAASPNEFRWIAAGMIVAGWIAAWIVPWPAVWRYRTCLFHRLTGYPCPFCGMTHACVYTAQGRFADALTASPMGTVFMVASVIILGLLIIRMARRSPRWDIEGFVRDHAWVRWGGLAALVANWVYLLAQARR